MRKKQRRRGEKQRGRNKKYGGRVKKGRREYKNQGEEVVLEQPFHIVSSSATLKEWDCCVK